MYNQDWVNPNWKTLIADDHEAICELLTRLTNKYIGNAVSCKDGHDAIKLFTEALNNGQAFDLVLLDIDMPYLEGTEVVDQIRQLEQESGLNEDKPAKIVLVTGYPDQEHIKEWFTTGFDQYLVKPISKENLLHTIQNLR